MNEHSPAITLLTYFRLFNEK